MQRVRKGAKRARVAADRAISGLVNGVTYLMDGSATPIGNTPKEVIFSSGKLEISHYLPHEIEEYDLGHETLAYEGSRYPVPILLVPPLMVKPYIYDLRPEHSFVRLLRRSGFDVYLVDFGAPDTGDMNVRLDDYVLEWLPAAVEAVRKKQGHRQLTMVGYCMGGLFSLLYTSAWRDADVRNIVTIAAPIDCDKMGMLSVLSRLAHDQMQFVADKVGNVPGVVNSNALKMLAPIKRVTRYADLIVNLWNDEYLRGFDAMNKWTSDFIAYPQQAFKQFMNEFMKENRLREGITFGDRVADLKQIQASMLSFGGTDDKIATAESCKALCGVTSSTDHTHLEVPGGHIGVVAGSGALERVWKPTAEWLRSRSALV